MNHNIILTRYGRLYKIIFSEIKDNGDFIVNDEILDQKYLGKYAKLYLRLVSHILNLFKKENIHNIRRYMKKWLLRHKFSDKKPICLIIDRFVSYYDLKKYSYIDFFRKKHPNSKIVLFIDDSIEYMRKHGAFTVEQLREDCDLILTVRKDDAMKYGFYYTGIPYARYKYPVTSYLKSDIVYIGYAKDGRHEGLQRIFRALTDKGLVVDMILVGVPEEERLYSNEIVYLDAPILYVTILERTNNSKCILVYETQSVFKNTEMPVNTLGSEFGGSIRLREAVVYNKKFLTNSIECTFSKYYDPKFMYVFEDADNLNFDDVVRFIRDDKEPVDYHYSGDYAPQLWIQQIDCFLADGTVPGKEEISRI